MPRLHSCLLVALLALPGSAFCADDAASATASDVPAKPPSAAVTGFPDAMASNDSDIKRAAIRALVGSDAGSDDVVLPLLVQAVGDRQAHDTAVDALRARTGLSPSPYSGQSHYPRYPAGDHAEDWNLWLSERTEDKAEKAKVANAEKLAKEANKTANKALKDASKDAGKDAGKDGDADASADATTASSTASATAAAVTVAKHQAVEDLGALNRIVFKNGSSLSCYILTRRTDADGNLLSLRVVHPDGSGEETLDASIIARVEAMH